MTLRSAAGRLLALFRRRNLDRDLEGEILAHLELAERDAIARGLTPEEARQAARRSFGGIEQMKEDHRDRRSVRWMENLLRDFRYGLATLARDPGFAAVTIGLLALGIGANTAMFSIVDAVLLKPLPFPDPERMVRVWEAPTSARRNNTTTLTFLDWKRQDTIFEALSVQCPTRAAVATGGDPARLSGKLVSADYFKVFGVKPRIGRTFAPEEDQPGATPVVVLSYSFWQTRFGGDPDVLKRDLALDGEPHRIVGVLPAGSFDRDEAGFWKPLIFTPDQLNRRQHWLQAVGRLRAGVSLEQARAKMGMLRTSLAGVVSQKDWGFAVDPFAQFLVGDTLRRSIYLAFGAVLMMLLIACANVANLMLAKGATRRKEMALRAALGASRGRLIGQLLTESLVLCLLGGAAGVAVAYLLLHAAAPLVAASLPFTADLSLDLRVLGFAAAAAIAVLILAGLLPSLQTSFGKLSNSLNQAARGSSGSSAAVRRTIVIGEVAASVVLICGAALLFKSLAKLQQVDAGVRIDHVITMSADLPSTAYPTPESAARFYEAGLGQEIQSPNCTDCFETRFKLTHYRPLSKASQPVVREMRLNECMATLLQDLRNAFRNLGNARGFALVAAATLAIGIGANTAIFSIIDTILLRPLPYRDPSQLVRLNETESAPGRYPFAGPDFVDWKAQNSTFQDMTLFAWPLDMNLSTGGQPEHVLALPTAANFFSLLGVDPLLGRRLRTGWWSAPRPAAGSRHR